jgi:hypothetical protein
MNTTHRATVRHATWRRTVVAPTAILAATLTALAACGDDGPDGNDGSGNGGTRTAVVATFEVAGQETFKVELAADELVEHAQQLLDGESVAAIPLGRVVRDDPGVNAPWSWHLDPTTFEFADATTEVCDGLPSFVEDRTVTSDDYCPWSAEVVAIERVSVPG